jgi:hypothetical protein
MFNCFPQEGQLFSTRGTQPHPPCPVSLSEVFGQFQNVVMGFLLKVFSFSCSLAPFVCPLVRWSDGPSVVERWWVVLSRQIVLGLSASCSVRTQTRRVAPQHTIVLDCDDEAIPLCLTDRMRLGWHEKAKAKRANESNESKERKVESIVVFYVALNVQ